MIAFKVFMLCPEAQRPLGIPLAYPWIQEDCSDSQVANYQRAGWTVVTPDEYTDYVTSLTSVLADYNTNKIQYLYQQVLSNAEAFGAKCIREFAAENIVMGITQAGMSGVVLTILTGVMQALLAGSLYEAMSRIRAVDPINYDGTFLTASRCLQFVNKIEVYLGIPLSSSL